MNGRARGRCSGRGGSDGEPIPNAAQAAAVRVSAEHRPGGWSIIRCRAIQTEDPANGATHDGRSHRR